VQEVRAVHASPNQAERIAVVIMSLLGTDYFQN